MTGFLAKNIDCLRAIAQLRTPQLDSVMALITQLGGETVFMVLLMAVFWCVDKKQGYCLMMIGFTGTIFNQFLKILVRIPRPWVLAPDFEIVEAAREGAEGYSFPSGHTQNAVGLLGSTAKLSRRGRVKIVCIAVIVLIAFSRLYLGVHTPLDVGFSAAVTLVLVFGVTPIYRVMDERPKLVAGIFACMIVAAILFRHYASAQQVIAVSQGLSEEDLANFSGAVKNAYCMLGASVSGLIVYILDQRYIRFETKAVWWAQGLKLLGGVALAVGIKSALKAPLYALMGASGDAVRYGLMILVAGAVWPLTFPWFEKLGINKAGTLQ